MRMFSSVCGEQQPHPARHEAGTEMSRALKQPEAPRVRDPPGEPAQRQLRPPLRKGQRGGRMRHLRQPQCRPPRAPRRQVRGLHRQSTTPGQAGHWARRTKGPHSPTGAQPSLRGRAPSSARRKWASAYPSILPRREKPPMHRRHPPLTGGGLLM
jgi:hypothetical protein